MGSQATTIDEQIRILRDERNMIIEDVDKCKEILADIGYYRLGFYWFHFEQKRKNKYDPHVFRQGTCFSNVVKLYYLDLDLRHILLKYLHRIEVHYRTKIIYLASNKYKSHPIWYSNSKYVQPRFIAELPKTYSENFKTHTTVIRKHHEKYKYHRYAPAWKSLEFFPFGTINALYKSLRDEDLKQEIASAFGYDQYKLFSDNMTALVFLRNACSHGNSLIDYNQVYGIRKVDTDLYKYHDTHSLNASLTLVLNLLANISTNRANELKLSIKKLFNTYRCNDDIRYVIEEKARYKIK